MRILVYGMVGTNRGGIETFLINMNRKMSDDTIFDYVIEEEGCIHESAIKEKKGEIFYISSRSKSLRRNIEDNKALLKKLRDTHDVVYFNLSSLSWIEPIKIALTNSYKVYVHSHNAEFIAANNDFFHKTMHYINKIRLSKYKITRLTCSKPATDFMFGNSQKVIMIHNAIETEKFKYNEDVRREIRKKLRIETKKVIGFVGRINDQKNPLFLPEIIKEVLEIRSDAVLIIIGDGPMRKQLENVIENLNIYDKCILTGNITNVNEYMQAFDIFVLPSLHEGLPYVAIEAQTSGLKCVLSDKITPEVNITGNVVFLPIDNPKEWGLYISKALEQGEKDRYQWYDYIKGTHFDINTEAKELETVLTERQTKK